MERGWPQVSGGENEAAAITCLLGMLIGSVNSLMSFQSPWEMSSSYSVTCLYLPQAGESPPREGLAVGPALPHLP